MSSLYNFSISELTGIGSKRAEQFHRLGVSSVGDLLRFYPRNYEDLSNPILISQIVNGERCVIKARVTSFVNTVRISGGRLMAMVEVSDDSASMNLKFFNNKYISSLLKFNEEYFFSGKATRDLYGFSMISPEFSSTSTADAIVPVYNLTAGLSNRTVIRAVKEALKMLPGVIKESLPYDIIKEYDLCSLKFALENIHFPSDANALKKARKRLIFEELLVLNLGLRMLKNRTKQKTSVNMPIDYTNEFIKRLPYRLTKAQQRAVTDCVNDMKNKTSPMNRLIQGDVGCGKTAVAAAVCYNTVKNGYQAAFMAPTEILAEQHYQSFINMFSQTGINIALLTGSLTPKQKKTVREKLSDGEIDIVIGTHALVTDSTLFKSLGCAITDEQHRFGVAQRSKLAQKGEHPHVLVLSATPIPRTLGLIIYGDLDITCIDELPPGRQEIKTILIDSSKRFRALKFIKKEIDSGRQCYIVCPLVNEGELDLASAEDYAAELMLKDFSDYPVGILHGKMKSKDKEEVMRLFSKNEISVLVSTTVIEVGVDVKNATIIMIENAERFGLSQLHQLRGRVGRGNDKSYCILVSDNKYDETLKRLSTMCKTSNGFEIADEDLRLRGPGDFFGNRQHGLPKLAIADFSDMESLRNTQTAAQKLIDFSPDLSDVSLKGLKAEISKLFESAGSDMLN